MTKKDEADFRKDIQQALGTQLKPEREVLVAHSTWESNSSSVPMTDLIPNWLLRVLAVASLIVGR